jgi:cell division septation protein DedD
MIKIEEIILAIIQDQKKIYLKNIGTLYVEKSGASIHPVTHEITPPHSILMFDRTLSGVPKELTNRMALVNNITIAQAEEIVSQYLDIIQNTLHNTRTFTINNICIVEKKPDDSYTVLLNDSVIIDKNDIGLKQIQSEVVNTKSTPIQEPTIQEPKKEITKMEEQNKTENTPPLNTPEVPNQPKKKGKGVWLVIIFILLAASGIMGYLFKDDILSILNNEKPSATTTDTTSKVTAPETPTQDVATTETTPEASQAEVKETVVNEPEKTVETAVVETPVKVKKSNNTEEKADLSVIVYAPKNAGKYYVIAASFKDLGNASKGIKQLKKKGYNPVVIDKNEQGLYRVAYKAGYDTERLARDFADDLYEKQNLDPWIVKY